MNPILSLCFVAAIALVSAADYQPCNCVAFRLDDVQDWFLTNAQKAVLDIFKDQKLPITAGYIGSYFNRGDGDRTMLEYSRVALQTPNWDYEVANHGWEHESFILSNLTDQTRRLQLAVTKTQADLAPYLTKRITTFMPPLNYFNQDTLTALKATGFDMISSDLSWYTVRDYPGTDSAMRELPIGSSTTNLGSTYKIDAAQSFELIQEQMTKKGFSAVMMHPQEFTYVDQSGYRQLNQTAIDDLKLLITMIKNANYKFVNLRGLRDLLWPNEIPDRTITSSPPAGGESSATTGLPAQTQTTSVPVAPTTSTTGDDTQTGCEGQLGCGCGSTCNEGLFCLDGVCVQQAQNDEESSATTQQITLLGLFMASIIGLSLL